MILEEFKTLYRKLDAGNIESVSEIYADDIVFLDPFHRIEGVAGLKLYFFEQYKNADLVEFDFGDAISEGNRYFIQWNMKLKHPRLNSGRTFDVVGSTLFKSNEDNKIIFHRDYFDAGSLLYERLPLVGVLVRWIKRQF